MPWEEYSFHGSSPSILTVQYNAWHYRNETEAWAGLAVEITKELEATMTMAHKLRTSWTYNWKKNKNKICLQMILPFFLALIVAIWFTTIVWLVFNTRKHEDIKKLKYGGLPASMIVVAWGLGKTILSFVKPISSHVVDYICLPDHSEKLGYHQKVIDDINFLKENLYYKSSLKWEVLAFIWCCFTWSWNENKVQGTKIPKMPPTHGNKLRMIVFVDDLDRCEENVILEILSGVNLVLATCKINVILSMENNMIKRAILRKYGNNNKDNKELAEKYVRKIVQLPLHLPDPSNSEASNFLKRQLGLWESSNGKGTRRHVKVNAKFKIQIATPHSLNPGPQGRKEYIKKWKTKLKEKRKDTHTAQQRSTETDRQAIKEIAEVSGVEELATTEGEEAKGGSNVEEIIDVGDESTKEDEEVSGDRNQQEGSKRKRSLMDDLSTIMSAMLIPRYTPGERNAFLFLHRRCTRSRKLPREWKSFLAYHRLAWNILYLTPFLQEDVNPVEGWQVQLIVWIFVCWEWRELITILIRKWKKLEVLRNWKGEEAPSLREIVEHYTEEELIDEKKSRIKEEDGDGKVESSSGELPEKVLTKISESQVLGSTASVSSSPEEEMKEDDSVKEALRRVLREQKEMREILGQCLKQQEEMIKDREEMRSMLKRLLKEEENKGESCKESRRRMMKKYLIEEEEMEGEENTADEEREEWKRLKETLRTMYQWMAFKPSKNLGFSANLDISHGHCLNRTNFNIIPFLPYIVVISNK